MNTSKKFLCLLACALPFLWCVPSVLAEEAPQENVVPEAVPPREIILDAAKTKGAVVVPDPKPEAQAVDPNTTRVYRGGKHKQMLIIKPADKSQAPPPKKKITVDYEPVD